MATNGASESADGLNGQNSIRQFDRSKGEVVTVAYNAPRERPKTDQDLEAGEQLNLGDFSDAHALSVSEVSLFRKI